MADMEHLTDDEREAIEAAAQAEDPIEDDPTPANEADQPWLDEARQEMREFLTDEELAALSEDDESGDGENANATPPTDAGEGAPVGEDTLEDGGEDDLKQDPEPAKDHEAAAPDKAPSGPDLTPEELAEIRNDFQAKMDKLDDDYDDGEITREQLREQRKALFDEQDRAIADRIAAKADDVARQEAEAFAESHRAAAKVFFAKNAPLAQDKALLSRFDVLQQQIQHDPKFKGKTSVDIFEEAKARLIDEARREGKNIPGLTGETKRPSHATRAVPPTVRDIPAAAPNEPEGSEIARTANTILAMMDKDPVRAEEMMRGLPADTQERILMGDF